MQLRVMIQVLRREKQEIDVLIGGFERLSRVRMGAGLKRRRKLPAGVLELNQRPLEPRHTLS
jgi:hypothetical protein